MALLHKNKYLTFVLEKEEYAIPIDKIKEIIGMMNITKVPRLPGYIKGVINLRGKIIPVLDLRLKFGLPKKEYDERTSIVIIEYTGSNGSSTSGFVVDAVKEVMNISDDRIDPPPKCESQFDQSFITGMGKVNDDVYMLLDVGEILAEKQASSDIA